jgi:hypothetical protein
MIFDISYLLNGQKKACCAKNKKKASQPLAPKFANQQVPILIPRVRSSEEAWL